MFKVLERGDDAKRGKPEQTTVVCSCVLFEFEEHHHRVGLPCSPFSMIYYVVVEPVNLMEHLMNRQDYCSFRYQQHRTCYPLTGRYFLLTPSQVTTCAPSRFRIQRANGHHSSHNRRVRYACLHMSALTQRGSSQQNG